MSADVVETPETPEKPEECAFCGWRTTALHHVEREHFGHNPAPAHWLCTICYSTLAGNAYRYPDQYENKPLMKQVSWIGNTILAAINRINTEKGEQ